MRARAQKANNESSAGVLTVRGTLLTASPVCQSRRTVLCAAEVLGHWIPCFSDSLLGTHPKRCCLSLGSPTVTDIHLLFSCGGAKWATVWPISMTSSTAWTPVSLTVMTREVIYTMDTDLLSVYKSHWQKVRPSLIFTSLRSIIWFKKHKKLQNKKEIMWSNWFTEWPGALIGVLEKAIVHPTETITATQDGNVFISLRNSSRDCFMAS